MKKLRLRMIHAGAFAAALFSAVLLFGLAGCDEPGKTGTGEEENYFTIPPVLTFAKGDGEGELKYSWTPATPNDGVEYALYVVQGEKSKGEEVVSSGEKIVTSGSAGTFTKPGGVVYSAVVVASKGKNKVYSNIATAQSGDLVPELRFGVLSDVHIGYTGRGAAGNLRYSLDDRLKTALQWYKTSEANVTAVVINGDLTENGTADQFIAYGKILNDNKGNLQVISVMGNHDAYPSNKNEAANNFESGTGNKTNAHYVVNGYHIIVFNGGSGAMTDTGEQGGAIATARSATPGAQSNTGDVIGTEIRTWLRTRINYAKEQAPGQPIFLFCHWPIYNTFYVSEEWYTSSFGNDPLTGWFKDDKEVVIFGGHIHTPNQDPRSIWQGGFTSVNSPSTNYMEMEKGYLGDSEDGTTNRTYPKVANAAYGQGLIVAVKGSKVTIENYDFDYCEGEAKRQGTVREAQTWEWDVTKPAEFPYTKAKRATQATAPVFDASAAASAAVTGKIRFSTITNTSVVVDFDQAVMPAPNPGNEVVHSYRFEFRNKANNSVTRTAYQWSDFMLTPRLRKTTYSQIIGGLTAGVNYELRIYAIGSFQKESAQYLTGEFTTTGGGATGPAAEYDLKFQNNLNNAGSSPSTVSMKAGTATFGVGKAEGEYAIRVNRTNYIELNPAIDYAQNITLAFWVKLPQGGTVSGSDPVIFSNKNWQDGGNPGFLIQYRDLSGTRLIQLNTRSANGTRLTADGSTDVPISPLNTNITNQWVHIAVVYDKAGGTAGQVRCYYNGVKVREINTDLGGTGMTAAGIPTYLGTTVENNNGTTIATNNVDADIQNFILKNRVYTDAEIAALAVK